MERKPLDLPDKSLSDEVLDKLSTLRRVRDTLKAKGVPLDMKPEFDLPEIPKDLSKVSNERIADLSSEILAWDNYFTQEYALAEAEAKEKKNKLELLIVKLSGGKQKRGHSMDLDPRVVEARAELQEAEQGAAILKTTHSIFSNRLKVVSRTIELRKMEWDKSHRDSGIRSAGYPHHSNFGARKNKD